ncbi:MOSC domain-containing protein [Frigoribacterium sp. PvP032]|uniref:MOSC domain-containing protein n=1 Tax=Frigoribacterium sp. PvP032 TaxID=2806589 RepID=UPI001AE22466|nr:MOSC domain-containing protein [Frigoribacterium sp. PvP032]MBP1189947.1 MOSC domain-containing protein YiiM [Frigoribacterium sp. PvP032]
MPLVTAVCRVHALLDDSGSVGVTAIDKRPVDGPVPVRKLGVRGDVQASRAHHGGEDKAVYAFADEDATHFAELLGRQVLPGSFGENLRTAGLDVTGAVIGERWAVGERLVLQVTMPRTPCATFARRLGERGWVRRFQEEGRPGAYLKVVVGGEVSAGDELRVVHRPEHGVSIGECFAGLAPERAALLLSDQEASPLAPVMRGVAELAASRP